MLIETLCGHIAQGNYAKTACALCGISEAAYTQWMRFGRDLLEAGRVEEDPTLDNHERLCIRLVISVAIADASGEDYAVRMWRMNMPDDYRACRDFLERRHPDGWNKVETRPLKKEDETPGLLKSLFDKLADSFKKKDA